MAKIDIGQIDEFKPPFLDDIQDGDVPVWNAAEGQFEPKPEPIIFRRAMLLMGA